MEVRDPEESRMSSLDKHRRAWEELGRVDPLWAVLTTPEHRHGRWDPSAFLASGQREVAAIMTAADQLGLPGRRDTVLDFGCGVGRLARAFRSYFASYTGVDISEPMLLKAREWHREYTSCSFVLNTTADLSLFGSGSFDLVHSKYVLQHLPSQRLVVTYVEELLRVLGPSGLLVFQIPSHIKVLNLLQPKRHLYGVLRRLAISERILLERLQLTPMRMRSMAEGNVVRLIQRLGGKMLRIDRQSTLEHTYFVTR
jgi:ubiquinone/menaquinone biosynthesis C-methylase UbiE